MAEQKLRESEVEEGIKELKEILKPGDTIYTVLIDVSRNGMTRWVNLYIIKDNKPYRILGPAAKALGEKIDFEKGGMKVSGVGSDVGYDIVYRLNEALKRATGVDYHLNQAWL